MRWLRKDKPPNTKKSKKDQIFDDPLQLVSRRLKTCEDALKRNPEDPDALFTKAVFLTRIHEYRRAIECLQVVTEQQPEYPMAWGLMSLVYSRMGDIQSAKDCREKGMLVENAQR